MSKALTYFSCDLGSLYELLPQTLSPFMNKERRGQGRARMR